MIKTPLKLFEYIKPVLSILAAILGTVGLASSLTLSLGPSKELLLSYLAVIILALAAVASAGLVRGVRKLPRARRIFLSYPREELALAREITERLRKEGARVWVDVEQIQPGAPIESAIKTAIDDADGVVVLLSSETSPNLTFELEYALAKHVRVIPVLLQSGELPPHIASLQYIDLRSDTQRGLDRLVEAVF